MKRFLEDLILEAGALVRDSFKRDFQISNKEGVNNLVTEVDRATERLITGRIAAAYPTHGFLGEEYGSAKEDSEYLWIIDPIDGTTNFAKGLPIFCISIALAHQGELLLGAIYQPITRELFLAEKGGGATLNGKPISVSANADFGQSFLVTGFPYHFPHDADVLAPFVANVRMGLPVRRLGSAAMDLAYVAAGIFDGFWEYNLSAWDIAAGYLLVSEAGGRVSDFSLRPGHYLHKETLATNGHIHQALLQTIIPTK